MKELAPFRFDPSLTGLWIGSANLDEVKEVASGNWSAAPATFPQTLILHVDGSGIGHLLQEATLMKTRDSIPEMVVVNQPESIPNYDGVVPRGGKLVGQRFSCSSLALSGGKASLSADNGWLSVTSQLAAAHPINPFRHKYHPDLAVGREIERTIRIQLTNGDSPSDHVVTGILQESVSGIHKDAIDARGPITFTRVSPSGQLR